MGMITSGKQLIIIALTSVFSGYLLLVAAVFPMQYLIGAYQGIIYPPAFFIMSALSIGYLIFSLVAYRNSYWELHKGALFSIVSGFYLAYMALLSSFSCLFVADPSNRLFFFSIFASLLLYAACIGFFVFLQKRKAYRLRIKVGLFFFATVALLAFVTSSRFVALFSDSTTAYFVYTAASVLFVTWSLFLVFYLTLLFDESPLGGNARTNDYSCEDKVLKKLIVHIIVASCLAILLPILGRIIAVSNYDNDNVSLFYSTMSATGFIGFLFFIYAFIRAVMLMRIQKIRDTILGIIAGFILILLWCGHFALRFIGDLDTPSLWFSFLWYGYPLISAVALVLLLKHKQGINALAKISIFLVSALIFYYLFGFFEMDKALMSFLRQGFFGGMPPREGFALTVTTFFYFGVNTIAVLLSLSFCKRKKTDLDQANDIPQ